MAKKDRNKRSARKARAEERARVEAAREASGYVAPDAETSDKDSSSKSSSKSSSTGKKLTWRERRRAKREAKDAQRKKLGKKPTWRTRIITYFSDVHAEMKRVTWPSKTEVKEYSIASLVVIIIFGVLVWLVDSGVVAILAAFTGLRG